MWIWFGYMSRVSDSGLLGVEGLGVLHGLGCKLQGPNPELIRIDGRDMSLPYYHSEGVLLKKPSFGQLWSWKVCQVLGQRVVATVAHHGDADPRWLSTCKDPELK